jgi:hypothetical protein
MEIKMSEINDPTGGKHKRPWYRRPVLMIVLGVLAVIIIASAVSGGGSKTTTTAAPAATSAPATPSPTATKPTAAPTTKAPAQAAAKIGTPVRDGKFEFTVTGVKAGAASVGDQYVGKQAQGQFVLVTVRVRNIGDKAQTVADSNQHLYDAGGRRFDTDTMAGIYANGAGSQVFITPINPGNSINGTLVFDVPAGTTPTTIELHDSAFSGGTKVSLT